MISYIANIIKIITKLRLECSD